MSKFNPDSNVNPNPGNSQPWFIGVAILLALGIGGSVFGIVQQHAQLVNARMEVAALRHDLSAVRQDVTTAQTRTREVFDTINEDMTATRAEAIKGADRARLAARKQTEALVSKVAVRQDEQSKLLTAELGQLKDTTDKASAQLTDIGSAVGDVKTEVGDVKTQVASTRTELDKTIAEMRRVNGDMGVMSGLVATNSKEVMALRALGERDYYEFSLGKAQASRLLAGVNLVYKKADPKRNRYTMQIVADDKRVEKRDRTVNEPVQFYVSSKARQPYEIVVNQVRKDMIVGYLSVPKTQIAQR